MCRLQACFLLFVFVLSFRAERNGHLHQRPHGSGYSQRFLPEQSPTRLRKSSHAPPVYFHVNWFKKKKKKLSYCTCAQVWDLHLNDPDCRGVEVGDDYVFSIKSNLSHCGSIMVILDVDQLFQTRVAGVCLVYLFICLLHLDFKLSIWGTVKSLGFKIGVSNLVSSLKPA